LVLRAMLTPKTFENLKKKIKKEVNRGSKKGLKFTIGIKAKLTKKSELVNLEVGNVLKTLKFKLTELRLKNIYGEFDPGSG